MKHIDVRCPFVREKVDGKVFVGFEFADGKADI